LHIHFGLDHLVAEWPRALVCIGTFDGVHRGHQAVIGRSVAKARALGVPCVLVTFDRNPAAILAPHKAPKAIGSIEGNLAEFANLGVDVSLVLPFTRQLADTSAEEFYETVLRREVRAEAIVIGHDFAFGHDRIGTPDWLRERIDTEVVPAFLIDGRRVSSTDIRNAVAEGRVAEAAELLGRPFSIPGVVVHGEKIGRQLGYPTANIARSFDQVMPANGIYAGDLLITGDLPRSPQGSRPYADQPNQEQITNDLPRSPQGSRPYAGQLYRAAISIGVRPTFEGTTRTIEAFLLDYKGEDFYGRSVTLSLTQRIRDEQRFESVELLKEQMARDVEAARG